MTLKIGAQISALRKKAAVTQDKLAESLGITAQAISRWESETCYPDIELLPAIADYFGVSVDDLMGIDQMKKDEKISEYIHAAGKIQWNGDFGGAVELYRQALKEFPSSHRLQIELACAIGAINNNTKISRELCSEVIDICNRLLDDSTDDNLRMRANAILCFVYCKHLDEREKAIQIAMKLPSGHRELAMAETLGIYLPSDMARKNIDWFISNILILFHNPLGYEIKSRHTECIDALIGELVKFRDMV